MITSNSPSVVNSTNHAVNITPSHIDRGAIRKALRRALLPSARVPQYQKQYWPKWVEDRLTTLAIYSYTDKTKCNPQHIQCLRLFSQGNDYDSIAYEMRLKRRTAEKYIYQALDWIIENTPDNLLVNIPISHSTFRLGGCPHCAEAGGSGDLLWDDADGEYYCLMCARRWTESNLSVKVAYDKALL